MRARFPHFALAAVSTSLALLVQPARGGGIGISEPPEQLNQAQTTSISFHPYKVPAFLSQRANRDLEFLWSDNYRALFNRPLDGSYGGQTDLDRFGATIAEIAGTNPFNFPFTDIKMVYDYFNRRLNYRDSTYHANPDSSVGFKVSQQGYFIDDAKHVDTYVYVPQFATDPLYTQGYGGAGDDGRNYGQAPSAFIDTLTEDFSTGHTGAAVLHLNSVMLPGPRPSQVGNLVDSTRWTGADALQSEVFNHEFQHIINYPVDPLSELFSSAAEALGGARLQRPINDVAYTWNLIRWEFFLGYHNYQAWRSFGAYLAFNFRGVDTTSAGTNDDLLWRWAMGGSTTHSLSQLIPRLSPAECAECATKSYFSGLAPLERFHLLIHNWRVANFVNNVSLAQGQFGFAHPPKLGFDPMRDVGSWQNVDGATWDDSVAVPHDITLSAANITREISLAGPAGGLKKHALGLENFGSDYWVLKSDANLASANRDLVVHVTPEGVCDSVRVMVSAIGYNNQPGSADSLWKHPEWATTVVPAVWVVANSRGNHAAELVIPNFGQTHKAALVVVTTSKSSDATDSLRVLPYRFNVALRTGAYLSPNPVVTFRDGTFLNLPSWHPQGDSIVFTRNVQGGGAFGELHVKAVNQSGSRRLVNPTQAHGQGYANWSPRADWVAFVQESTSANCDVLVYNSITGELRRLASSQDHEVYPAFSPNGQQLVYSRRVNSSTDWQLRRVNLDGTGDIVLLTRFSSDVFSPRWSPNGQWIYFTSGTTLYAVSSSGGTEIVKSQLIPSAKTFDLALGGGRIVAEDAWVPASCGQAGGTTYARLVARDTTSSESESEILFFNSGTNPYAPRWSFDNTRVAFAVDSAGSRSIRVGQVGYNHAPRFNAQYMVDAQVSQSVPVSFTLSATDADGEPITYEAAYLPPGATLSSNGAFNWPDPEPYGARYYVVFRAIDQSGGVDNRVIMYEVGVGGGGGCPMVDARTNSGWKFQNSILGRSAGGEFMTDFYRLSAPLAPNGDRYEIRIRENELESPLSIGRRCGRSITHRASRLSQARTASCWANGKRPIASRQEPARTSPSSSAETGEDSKASPATRFWSRWSLPAPPTLGREKSCWRSLAARNRVHSREAEIERPSIHRWTSKSIASG